MREFNPLRTTYLLLFLLGACTAAMLSCEPGGTRLDDYICLPADYSRTTPPKDYNVVDLGIRVEDFTDIDVIQMTYTMRLKIYMKWEDPQIQFGTFPDDQDSRIVNSNSINSYLWRPDLFLYNMVSFSQDKVFDPLSGVHIYNDGTVGYYSYASVKLQCPMDFEVFPFDTQECRFVASSSSYDNSILKFKGTFDAAENLDLQAFEIILTPYDVENLEAMHGMTSGNLTYSQVGFGVTMKRNSGVYVFKYIIPTCSMVILSWISFLIPPTALPGRVGLLVTLFLVLQTMFRTVEGTTPISSKMTTLSEYVVTCIVFVFLAMMEFACVLVFSRYQDHLKEKQAQEVEKAAPNPEGAEVEAKKKKITGKLGNMVAKAAFKMDTIALGLFMLMFFIYNVAYFMVNTSKTVQEKEEDAEG